jgi:hypothetical protein
MENEEILNHNLLFKVLNREKRIKELEKELSEYNKECKIQSFIDERVIKLTEENKNLKFINGQNDSYIEELLSKIQTFEESDEFSKNYLKMVDDLEKLRNGKKSYVEHIKNLENSNKKKNIENQELLNIIVKLRNKYENF